MRGFGYKFIKKLDTHYSITTEKMLTATDISGNCKAVLGYLNMYLLAGKPFYQDNKTIGKAFHKSPRTIGRILNKLVTQNYIRFNYDKKDNYRIITRLNLDKIGLANKCKKVTIHITPYRSRNNYHKIINKPVTHKASQSIHNTKPVTHHTYPASPSKSASHKLTTAQLNILKSDAKLATKLFPNYVPKSAMSGLVRECTPDKYGHSKIIIRHIPKALVVVKYSQHNTNFKIKNPVAYSCSISEEDDNTLNNQYKKAKAWLDKNKKDMDKDKINKELGKKSFIIKSNKILVNSSMTERKFDNKIRTLRQSSKYSNKTLDAVMQKYNTVNNIQFNYGDDF